MVPTATAIHEFDVIQRALAEAGSELKQFQRDRELAYEESLENETKLRLALNAGELGSWEFTPATGEFITSATCEANFGRFLTDSFSYQDLVASIHPDDRPKQAAAVANAVETRSDLHIEYRVIWPDDGVHWIRVSGRVLTGRDGRLTMVGVSQDITERKRADDRQRLLVHELNHRVKNTLATVQSVASLTRRSARGPVDSCLWDAFAEGSRGWPRRTTCSRPAIGMAPTSTTSCTTSCIPIRTPSTSASGFGVPGSACIRAPLSPSGSPSTNWRRTRRNTARCPCPTGGSALCGA
jgi:hypothetical protein